MSSHPLGGVKLPLAATTASACDRNSAIGARVTFATGANSTADMPRMTFWTRICATEALLSAPRLAVSSYPGSKPETGSTPAARSSRVRNSAIWRRLTGRLGENSVADVPRVMPRLNSRATAVRASSSTPPRSVNPGSAASGDGTSMTSSSRVRNSAIWRRVTGRLGEYVVADVPRVMPASKMQWIARRVASLTSSKSVNGVPGAVTGALECRSPRHWHGDCRHHSEGSCQGKARHSTASVASRGATT